MLSPYILVLLLLSKWLADGRQQVQVVAKTIQVTVESMNASETHFFSLHLEILRKAKHAAPAQCVTVQKAAVGRRRRSSESLSGRRSRSASCSRVPNRQHGRKPLLDAVQVKSKEVDEFKERLRNFTAMCEPSG